jgi:acyl dehydratase
MRAPVRVAAGEAPEPRVIGPISQTDVVRFAGAGGDFNPLHHDPELVRSSGFPGVISMGQLQAGMLAGWVSDWLGVEHLRSLDVRFVAPVFLGDTITLSGEVETVTDGIASLTLLASKQDGSAVVTGRATARVAR